MSQKSIVGRRLVSGTTGALEMFLLNEAKRLEAENELSDITIAAPYRITCECNIAPVFMLDNTEYLDERLLAWYDPLFTYKNPFVIAIKKTYRCYHGKTQLSISSEGHDAYMERFSMTPRRYKAIHALLCDVTTVPDKTTNWPNTETKDAMWYNDIAEEKYWYDKFSFLRSEHLTSEEPLNIFETREAHINVLRHCTCAEFNYNRYLKDTRMYPQFTIMTHTLFKDVA